MKQESKPTVHDVAKLAGVSTKTVSRVMNNDPGVREQNRVKVLEAIEQTGYRPDINARRLRTRQSYLICLLYIDYVSNSYTSRLTSGAIEVCDAAGYDLLVRPVKINDKNKLYDQIKQILLRSNPDGFIVPPPLCDDKKLLNIIEEKGKRIVKILPMDLDEASCVYCDIDTGVREAISHLISLGHTRIAMLNFNTVHGGILRFQGYREAHQMYSLPLDDSLIFQKPMSDEEYEIIIRKLLLSDNPPTAFFTFNDYLATIVYRITSQLKLRIPNDISVIGFDDDPVSRHMWPPLSTIHQPVVNLGHAAAEKLICGLIQSAPLPSAPDLSCYFIDRSSCGPAY